MKSTKLHSPSFLDGYENGRYTLLMTRLFILGSIIIVVLAFSPAFCQEQTEKGYETAMTLGSFQIETGEYANAVESFKKALAVKPADKAALVSLGIAYSRSGDLSNARETLQRALAVDPADQV